MSVIKFEPVYKKSIWGGEEWHVSAHENGDCVIDNGEYKGKTLSWLWENKHELFGDASGNSFPLLVKIICAINDLSIQVHPNDETASLLENSENGKEECWYILDCDKDTKIIIGHNAQTKEELEDMIASGNWKDLLIERAIKPGDFLYIPAGCIHAIKGGTTLLEIQQNCDITYRLYDYDRLENGQPRKLDVEKAKKSIIIPYDADFGVQEDNGDSDDEKLLLDSEKIKVKQIIVDGEKELCLNSRFATVTVVEGNGTIEGTEMKTGDSVLLLVDEQKYSCAGKMKLIVAENK